MHQVYYSSFKQSKQTTEEQLNYLQEGFATKIIPLNQEYDNPQKEQRSGLRHVWHKIAHERLFYLFFFTIGSSVTLIVSIFFSIGPLIIIKIVEVILLTIAVIIKSSEVFKKLTCKEMVKTQSEFPIPYLFTILNIFLLAEVCGYMNQYSPSSKAFNDTYAAIEGLRFFYMTYMCSLVTNKKTTSKVEYWYYTAIIIIVVCCDVYIIVLKIRGYGTMLDNMSDTGEDNLISYLNNQISDSTYQAVKNALGIQQTAIENASALDIACVASVVANYLVMMDMISRPIEKIEHQEHMKHEIHASLHGGSGKHDIQDKLLNHSASQSERSYQPTPDHNKGKTTKNANYELQPRKSQL